MSAHAAVEQHDDTGHIHMHHVSSTLFLGTILGILLVLTVLTVAVSRVDLGGSLNMIIAMSVACVKAGLVIAFFMHLFHDKPFNAVLLFYTILTVGTFFLFTMIDLSSRDAIDPIRNVLVAEPSVAAEAAINAAEEEEHAPAASDDHEEPAGAESH